MDLVPKLRQRTLDQLFYGVILFLWGGVGRAAQDACAIISAFSDHLELVVISDSLPLCSSPRDEASPMMPSVIEATREWHGQVDRIPVVAPKYDVLCTHLFS